jgi:hypothetical protein
VKRHAILLHKIAPCPHRANAEFAHIGLSNAAIWRIFGESKQWQNPLRRRAVRPHGRASLTGPISGSERFTSAGKELDVFRVGPSRWARWQTEDAGSPNGSEEDTIVRGIFEEEGPLHFGSWWQLNHVEIIRVTQATTLPEKRHRIAIV